MALLKLVLFFQLVGVIMSTNVIANLERKILDQIFSPTNYDKRIRPRYNSTGTSQNFPVNITADMYILSLSVLNEEKQTYNIDVYFRESWIDDRLKYDSIISGRTDIVPELSLNTVENLWIPDIFFPNEIKGYLHTVTTPNLFVKISPDGHVRLSLRLNLHVVANYKYKKFPFDCQQLQLRIESYGYKTDDVLLQWKENDAVTITDHPSLSLFSVEKLHTTADRVKMVNDEYSTLQLQITIARKFNYYLNQVFIPCTMCVVVGYLSFWLDIKFITGRVILSVTTLYSLGQLISNFNSHFPKVSYTKLFDVYTGVCMTFVFAAVVEVIVAQACENSRCRNTSSSSEEPDQNSQVKKFNVKNIKQWLQSTPLNKVDAIFRIIYPIAYIIFNILFAIAVFV